MILKNDKTSSRWTPKGIAMLLLGGLLSLFALVFYYNNNTVTTLPEGGVFCDAEVVVGDQFKTGDQFFDKGQTQSSDFAHSGNYSCKLNKGSGNQFGFSYKLENPEPGTIYKATVRRLSVSPGQSWLVVSGPPQQGFYKSEALATHTGNDWEQIIMRFSIPFNQALDYLQIYVYSDGMGTVYFDDLRIEKSGSLEANPDVFDLDTVRISIADKAMEKLQNKRLTAFRTGILESSEDDWVKGKIASNNNTTKKIKLRLKGDWLNHLEGDKWSFRVKLEDGDAWNRLRVFSLHTPAARGFLHEWFLHQFFQKEDVLTTTYEFVLLELNGKSLGVYALEEHFDKVLVESRQRREGVIVKFSEAGFWASLKRQLQETNRIVHGFAQNEKRMQAAEVIPFAENTALSSPILTQQFQVAQELLQQYQLGNKPVSEVFDVDRMARYFAICDVLGAYHGMIWHNMRFYYNPLSAKLEPIGYDGFETTDGYRDGFTGQGALNPLKINEETFHFRLFLDTAFVAKYVEHLYHFSEKDYLQKLLVETEAGYLVREQLLQIEFPDYVFRVNELFKDALSTHLMVLPHNDLSLKAYTEQTANGNKLLKVGNVHSLPITIVGYGSNANTLLQKVEKPLLLEGFYPRSVFDLLQEKKVPGDSLEAMSKSKMVLKYESQLPLRLRELTVPEQARYLFYKPLGLDTLLHSPISNWPSPYDPPVVNTLLEPSHMVSNDLYRLDGNVLFFPNGNHILDKPLVVPKGYRLHFEAGCQIDFQQGAFIWSNSPVTVHGIEEMPVRFETTDGSGRGFHVMEPNDKSVLRYAHFDGMNTLDVKEQRLTGAVTFYESEVELYHCVFRKNTCEDALNLIRSTFLMDFCVITETFADGFDADFCKGRIKRSRFTYTGNDGLDISGSVVLLEKSHFISNGDKAISVGEDSDATILSASITDAPIAIAVKDLSTAVISEIKLENCRQGFVAFQKKPEYGKGHIVVESYEAINVVKLYDDTGGKVLIRRQ